jgi:hypothetical protein
MKPRTIETVSVSWARDGLPFTLTNLTPTKAREMVEALLTRARGGERISVIRHISKTEVLLDAG